MAIIPSSEKVFMVDQTTNTKFSGSAATKAMAEWYTMQDIIDTVGGGGVFEDGAAIGSIKPTDEGGRQNVLDSNSTCSSILGGDCNTIEKSEKSTIVGGYNNCVYAFDSSQSCNNFIGGSGNSIVSYSDINKRNVISGSCSSIIQYGNTPYSSLCTNSISGATYSYIESCVCAMEYNNIIGGNQSLIRTGLEIGGGIGGEAKFNSIVGGYYNYIKSDSSNLFYNQVFGGNYNKISQDTWSVVMGNTILGGYNNQLRDTYQSAILGGYANCVATRSANSSILTGYSNVVDNSNHAITLGGCYSSIINGSTNSLTLGGYCNTMSAAYSSVTIAGRYNVNNCNYSIVSGTGITADRDCSTFVNNLSIKNIPTVSTGLPSGSVWSNSGVLNIVS